MGDYSWYFADMYSGCWVPEPTPKDLSPRPRGSREREGRPSPERLSSSGPDRLDKGRR